MQNRRLLFSVIIKLMMFLGLFLLTLVLLNSLFTDDSSVPKTVNNEISSVTLDITEMQSGQIKKVRWNNKEVAILLRQFPDKLMPQSLEASPHDLHPSINAQTRSKKIEYFVYFNTGDSKNCPLYYAGGEFKDVCSSNRFDEAGRDINTNSQAYKLEIPPHYFVQDQVVFGKWES